MKFLIALFTTATICAVAFVLLPTDVVAETTIEYFDDVVLVTKADGTTETVPRELYTPVSVHFSKIDWSSATFGSCWTERTNPNYIMLTCASGSGDCNFSVNHEDGTLAASVNLECGTSGSVFYSVSTKAIVGTW